MKNGTLPKIYSNRELHISMPYLLDTLESSWWVFDCIVCPRADGINRLPGY